MGDMDNKCCMSTEIKLVEMICYRRMLRISLTAHRLNISILRELSIELNDSLLPSIQRRMLKFHGHVLRKDVIDKITNYLIKGRIKTIIKQTNLNNF